MHLNLQFSHLAYGFIQSDLPLRQDTTEQMRVKALLKQWRTEIAQPSNQKPKAITTAHHYLIPHSLSDSKINAHSLHISIGGDHNCLMQSCANCTPSPQWLQILQLHWYHLPIIPNPSKAVLVADPAFRKWLSEQGDSLSESRDGCLSTVMLNWLRSRRRSQKACNLLAECIKGFRKDKNASKAWSSAISNELSKMHIVIFRMKRS